MPSVSARCASSVAYSPGMETSATLASSPRSDRGGSALDSPVAGGGALSSDSTASSRAGSPSIAITTSVGPASTVTPSADSASRFAGVPIATSARPCSRRSFAIRIRRTLST
jgi:hypothetical protein